MTAPTIPIYDCKNGPYWYEVEAKKYFDDPAPENDSR